MARLRFHENTLYVIKNSFDDTGYVSYYQSPTSWTISLQYATIFRDFDVAEEHLIATFILHGNDGSFYDIVPLKAEMESLEQKSDK